MPELPDVVVYIDRLRARIQGQPLQRLRIFSPFLLRTVDPRVSSIEGRPVVALRRLGKQIVFEFPDQHFAVVHLMIAGRFHWKPAGPIKPGRTRLASFEFPTGIVLLTEASTKKRAALHLVRGEAALVEFDRGGIDVLEADLDAFRSALDRENHTLKRALTDPRLLDGIGNAYSDEILHRARLSPLKLTRRLAKTEVTRLHSACQVTLRAWIEKLGHEVGEAFPEKVTAFRTDMAVHGRYGKPCPECASPVQRIVYAENECNYCPRCQTNGKLLADRALSRLLKKDWPRTLEELDERKRRL